MEGSKTHIGTSGWSYKDWKGLFYPEKLKSTDWLAYYAQRFPITEINSSFYHLPRKQTVENWVQNTPPGFLFCPKMSRHLTHLKRLKEPEEPLERFFSVFEPMQPKMGPVLLQLPPSLGFDPQDAAHLFTLLKKDYAAYHFALEVRHKSWLEEESLALLARYSIALVLSESGNRFPYAEKVTARSIYIRFHGPNGRYNTSYDGETLRRFARLFLKWQQEGHELWIFFNNDYYGHAIQNARQLEEWLRVEDAAG